MQTSPMTGADMRGDYAKWSPSYNSCVMVAIYLVAAIRIWNSNCVTGRTKVPGGKRSSYRWALRWHSQCGVEERIVVKRSIMASMPDMSWMVRYQVLFLLDGLGIPLLVSSTPRMFAMNVNDQYWDSINLCFSLQFRLSATILMKSVCALCRPAVMEANTMASQHRAISRRSHGDDASHDWKKATTNIKI